MDTTNASTNAQAGAPNGTGGTGRVEIDHRRPRPIPDVDPDGYAAGTAEFFWAQEYHRIGEQCRSLGYPKREAVA